jgi:hypothetical protein
MSGRSGEPDAREGDLVTQYPQGPSYPPPPGSGSTGRPPGAPKMANRHLMAVLVVLLVAGGIGTYFAATSGKGKSSHQDGSGGSPAAVAANFYAAMNAHNIAALRKLTCTSGGSISGLEAILGNASAAKSLSDPVVSGSTATGKGTVTFKTGGVSVPLNFTMTFAKQGDGWCVQNATPQFPNLPTGSTSASTSPSSSPTSAPALTGTCRVPSGATSASVVPPELLKGGLDEKTLTTPADKWKYSSGGVSLSSYCFNGVTQSDLGPFLAYCDGAGWTSAPGNADNQLQLTRSDSLTPKNVLITVSGTLKLDRENFDANSGSVVISWY